MRTGNYHSVQKQFETGNGTRATITRNGSFKYENDAQGVLLQSSKTGETSPYQDGKPVNLFTIYSSKDINLRRDTKKSVIGNPATGKDDHIPEIHLKKSDAEPSSSREHTHLITRHPIDLKNLVLDAQDQGILPYDDELSGYQKLWEMIAETKKDE